MPRTSGIIPNSTVSTDALLTALDEEFVANFDHEAEKLYEVLDIVTPEVIQAGTALYQYTVNGELNNEASEDGRSSGTGYVEGEEVALSKYTLSREPIGESEMIPYRKLTTAQAIAKYGFENAVMREDRKMLKDVRKGIWTRFFQFLATGTGTVPAGQSTATLQATLANVEASLEQAVEDAGDELSGRVIHFVNRFDAADYLASAAISTQTVFGMTYLEDFLGVKDVFVGGHFPKGTVIATPAENIHLYGIDFSSLDRGGLSYTTSDSGLIGVHHDAAYNRVSCQTHVLTGAALLAEVKDFIVKATITPTV